MPVILSSSGKCAEELAKIPKKQVRQICAYVPDDDGGSVIAVFDNFHKIGKASASGLPLSADMEVVGAPMPKRYNNIKNGVAKGLRVHLCGKKSCSSYADAVHLGEWAHKSQGDNVSDVPLLKALVGFKPGRKMTEAERAAVHPGLVPSGTPGGASEQSPGSTPRPADAKQSQARPVALHKIFSPGHENAALAKWTEENSIGEFLDDIVANGFTNVQELSFWGEAEVEAFLVDLEVSWGSKCRFRHAINKLREELEIKKKAASVEPGSGWFVEGSGRELPVSALRGASLGGPELVLWEDLGVGVVEQNGKWQRIVKKAAAAAASPAPAAEEHASCCGPSDFVEGGPLAELAMSARELLARVEGTEAQTEPPMPRTVRPLMPQSHAAAKIQEQGASKTRGGRFLAEPLRRAAAVPVALRIEQMAGAAIWDEWSSAGTVRLQEAVTTRSWREKHHKTHAFDYARAIDVMKDSGLDPSTEPVAEVLLRALAATWFADRYPKDTDTAALLKESSMSNFGIPRNLWEEAKLIRKLIGKATTETDA